MADGVGFKERARAYEQRENWKRAIEEYELAIQADRTARREADLAVYNRVGDLYRRIGNINKAVHFYELAADGHLAAGFYNNAIALCNKILRNQPNRHSAYLKLGKIGAAKGFLSDARKHFLEYAERMKRANQLNDAFAALIEFADLSPDPEVRLMIADQLIGHHREGLAVEQLRLAWRDLVQDGREADAEQVRERILDLAPDRDPEVDPPAEDATTAVETDALGILDLPEILPFEELPADRSAKAKPKSRARDEARVAELDFLEEPTEATVDAAAEAPEAAVVADERPLLDDIMGTESDTAAGLEIETEDLELDGSGYTAEAPVDSEVEVEADALEIIPTSLVPGEQPVVVEAGEDLDIEPTQLADTDYGVSTEATAEEVGVAGLEPPLVDETVELLDVSPADAPLELEGVMDGLEIGEPVPQASVAGPEQRVAGLEGRLRSERRTPELLVELAEARLELDEREQASADLREALELYEEWGQYSDAKTVLDELLRLDVNDVRAYQKGVELALRAEDRGGLVNAYLALADCLQRVDASEKARIVYRRVMELDPGNTRAEAALEIFGEEEPRPARPAAVAPRGRAAQAPGEYVNLAELVREEEEVKARSTRFRLPTPDPQSEDEVNFSEMLSQFKSMVSEAIDEQDSSSHYDLGVAYKEMGLLDEAIAEFQVAARDLTYRLRAIEMLGTCFSEKGDHRIALKVLKRAEQTRDYRDEDLIGILYAMGRAHEELGEKASALECYERVIGCQVSFRDAARRVRALRQ